MNDHESYSNIRENRILMILFLLLLATVLCGLLYIFRSYFFSFLIALIFYFPLKPLNDKICHVIKKKTISSAIIILLLFALIVIPASFAMAALGRQSYQLYVLLQSKVTSGLIDNIQNSELFKYGLHFFDIDKDEIVQRLIALSKEYVFPMFLDITSLITFQLDVIVKFLCMMLMLFFLLKDGDKLAPIMYRALPFPDDLERMVIQRLSRVINVLVVGNLFIMLLQGFMLFLGMYLAGFSAPILWGTIGSIFSLIPVIGTAVVWLPAAIYLAATGSYVMAVFIAVWSLVWYFLLENLLKPIFFGGTLSFHPLVFFFLLLGSIQTFGIPGVLIGPIILTFFVSLWEIYKVLDIYNTSRTKVQD